MTNLSNTPFYHGNITKYTIAFADLFSNISVIRDGSLRKIPIAYENQQQFIRRKNERNSMDGDINVRKTVPRLSFTLSGLSYASQRMTSKYSSITGSVNSQFVKQFKFVPYDFSFTLSAISTSMVDILQILEQIAPYFSPNVSLKVADNPLYQNKYSDILLFLESTNIESDIMGEFSGDKRYHTLEMNFKLEGNLYGPLPESRTKDGIKHVIINYSELLQNNLLGDNLLIYEAIVNPINASKEDDPEIEEFFHDDTALYNESANEEFNNEFDTSFPAEPYTNNINPYSEDFQNDFPS